MHTVKEYNEVSHFEGFVSCNSSQMRGEMGWYFECDACLTLPLFGEGLIDCLISGESLLNLNEYPQTVK